MSVKVYHSLIGRDPAQVLDFSAASPKGHAPADAIPTSDRYASGERNAYRSLLGGGSARSSSGGMPMPKFLFTMKTKA